MHIINAMFSKGLGGIEQCFVDYAEALSKQGHKVTCLVQPDAAILPALEAVKNIDIVKIANHGQWDMFAKLRIRRALRKRTPDVIISHGNRALRLMKKRPCPLVMVTHNYHLSSITEADAAIAITEDLKKAAIEHGMDEENILCAPNMIRPIKGAKERTASHTPPVIGAMGRLVRKKGFETFIEALAILKNTHIPFRAQLAGIGEEEEHLRQLAKEEGLEASQLEFAGWINNKEQFFDNIDIFCLPSLHEPFGIILLEAFAHGIPVVSSASEGPREIITDKHDALLATVNDPRALADALQTLISEPKTAKNLAKNALDTVTEKYAIDAVGKQLSDALEAWINKHSEAKRA